MWIQWVALQATCGGVRLGPGDNRLAPIGPGYSRMFVFQTKMGRMVVWWKLYASNLSRYVGGNRHVGAAYENGTICHAGSKA
jgi:hypothetical protein